MGGEKCRFLFIVGFLGWITPAWAGKRGVEKKPCLWYTDHPRVGGEKVPSASVTDHVLGSPPRGRGKALLLLDAGVVVGITPAWAGKSPRHDRTQSEYRDHPRACGEKNKELEGIWLPMGSPPRGRGKVHVLELHVVPSGITPA